jgi:Flp pilus assembly pilin Flp
MTMSLAALARAFWKDENGFIVSAELVLVSTITVLSMIVGLTSVSQAINNELLDVANAFNAVNQGNGFNGPTGNGGRQFTANNGGIVPR